MPAKHIALCGPAGINFNMLVRRAKRLYLWTLFVLFRQFFVMNVDVDSQLSAVRGENPTRFYSHSHAILDEAIILRVFLQAQSRSGCALFINLFIAYIVEGIVQ